MVQVHHLNCVEIQAPVGGRAIGHCLLVQTDDRLILIDTGIGLQDTLTPLERLGQPLIDEVGFQLNEASTAFRQIERMDLDPHRVTDCILTHLDPDHAGGLADFSQAQVHVSSEEYENFKSGNPRYLPIQLAHRPALRTYAASDDTWLGWEARKITGIPNVELYLIPLFGHTLGHCGVALQTPSGWILYAGDAYYLRAELTEEHHPIDALATLRADANDKRKETLKRLREFVAAYPDVLVFGYHDPEEWKAIVADKPL